MVSTTLLQCVVGLQDNVPDRKLSEVPFRCLLDSLCGMADRWEELANYLPNMPDGAIAVVRNENGDASKKLFYILQKWLKGAHPAPTVKGLTSALQSPFLSENQIARVIEEKFLHNSKLAKSLYSLCVIHNY